jgi:hypothetical protein
LAHADATLSFVWRRFNPFKLSPRPQRLGHTSPFGLGPSTRRRPFGRDNAKAGWVRGLDRLDLWSFASISCSNETVVQHFNFAIIRSYESVRTRRRRSLHSACCFRAAMHACSYFMNCMHLTRLAADTDSHRYSVPPLIQGPCISWDLQYIVDANGPPARCDLVS